MTSPRRLPSVHALAESPLLARAQVDAGHELVVAAVRAAIDEAREHVLAGRDAPTDDQLAERAAAQLREWTRPRPQPLINATGVIVHTNLGRAPVSRSAAAAMQAAAQGYSDLEYDLAAGSRGSRDDLIEGLLCLLTGAEAGLVVNNNAGALLLVLTALARDREVVVSRGHLVEIGGGFRIPSIMAAGGAWLAEVGTTNRTNLDDYRSAISDDTALILRVHTSNFRVLGFVQDVPLSEMVTLGHEHGLIVVDDLGSGSLIDTSRFGLAPEPLVTDSVAAGADIVTFSGDKLLGGPQAGLVIGRADLIKRLRRHPFTRALRPGKATLAGLHATLMHYARGEALEQVPVWRMISAAPGDLAQRAAAWVEALAGRGIVGRTADGLSAVGGGSLPGETLPTTIVVLDGVPPDKLAAELRAGETPVVARIADDALTLDPRTVLPDQDDALLEAVATAVARLH